MTGHSPHHVLALEPGSRGGAGLAQGVWELCPEATDSRGLGAKCP